MEGTRIVAKALRNYGLTSPSSSTTSRPAQPNQVANNSGGHVFQVSDEQRLLRFLILGTDGGTFYVNELDLTKQNVDFLRTAIQRDEARVRKMAVDVSDSGRAYRNDAAVFVMAMLLAVGKDKAATVAAVPQVVRTAPHAYQLAEFIKHLAGWGPAKMAAIRAWFYSKEPAELAYQAVKYRQRGGWTMRDLLRLAHPGRDNTPAIDSHVAEFILHGTNPGHLAVFNGFERMQAATSPLHAVQILRDHPNLPWETIPTQFHKELVIWRQLFENGQLKGQALLRNVTRLAKLGAFDDGPFSRLFADRLRDEQMIAKTRLHPLQYLNAYVAYNEGQGKQTGGGLYGASIERTRTWVPAPSILDALDDGFGLAFGNIEPAGKRTMISIDTSGSMSWYLAGNTQLSAYQAAGAMGLITARTEPDYAFNAFASGRTVAPLNITAADTIGSATQKLVRAGGGGTNISLPMTSAREFGWPVDTFVVITDNEVNPGYVQPFKALEQYRQATGIDARLVVMTVVPTKFTVANPDDAGMLDVVGFDTNTPRVLADFSAGRI